jgi:hypothetical protein
LVACDFIQPPVCRRAEVGEELCNDIAITPVRARRGFGPPRSKPPRAVIPRAHRRQVLPVVLAHELRDDLADALRAAFCLRHALVLVGNRLRAFAVNLPRTAAVLFAGGIAEGGDPIARAGLANDGGHFQLITRVCNIRPVAPGCIGLPNPRGVPNLLL